MDILVLPATEVTAPAKKSVLLLTWGKNAPMRVTLNLPKISAAASIEMQTAESVLEYPSLRTTSGNSAQYVTSAKNEMPIPTAMLTYTGSSSRRRSRKSTTAHQALENL